jgi:hypothetical protein
MPVQTFVEILSNSDVMSFGITGAAEDVDKSATDAFHGMLRRAVFRPGEAVRLRGYAASTFALPRYGGHVGETDLA